MERITRDRSTKSHQLHFIITKGPVLLEDKETRGLIRHKASVYAAARRRSRHRHPNRCARSTECASCIVAQQDEESYHRGELQIAEHRLTTDYETARSRFNADIMALSSMACFKICGFTKDTSKALFSQMGAHLDGSQWSYLRYIPARYGYTQCLTQAVNCLMARMYRLLTSADMQQSDVEIKLYCMALRALKSAIESDNSIAADVLCAAQILAFFEALDPTSESSYALHTEGCTRIIKHRGPQRFEDDFERALLLANLEACTLKSAVTGTRSFLAEDEWLAVYRTLAVESDTLSIRSSLAVQAKICLIRTNDLWIEFCQSCTSSAFFTQPVSIRLHAQCLRDHDDLMRTVSDCAAFRASRDTDALLPHEIVVLRDVEDLLATCSVMTKRLLATVSEPNRIELEKEAQASARDLVSSHRSVNRKSICSAHEGRISRSVLASAATWLEDGSEWTPGEQRRKAYERWASWQDQAVPVKR